MFALSEPPLFTRLRTSERVLENLAALQRSGAYLGAFSIPPASTEAAAYLRAVEDAQAATPHGPSIVNGQIAASLRGEFGNSQFTDRTEDIFEVAAVIEQHRGTVERRTWRVFPH